MPDVTLGWYRDSETNKLSAYVDASGNPIPRLLGRANFTSGTLPPAPVLAGYTWASGGINTPPYIDAGALRMDYPAIAPLQGALYNYLHFDLPPGHKELYIKFDAQMPDAKHGLKFLKIFGRTDGTGVANTTVGLNYTGIDNGALLEISFGDGEDINNDTQNVLKLNGLDPESVGRSWGEGAVVTSAGNVFPSTAWGTGVHTFRFKIKLNDGSTSENEVNNAEYSLSIDGSEFVSATGLFNRNPANSPFIGFLSWGDWSQAPASGSPAFNIRFDNIFISSYGFYEGV